MKWNWDVFFLCIGIGTIINGIVVFKESIFNVILALVLVTIFWIIFRVADNKELFLSQIKKRLNKFT